MSFLHLIEKIKETESVDEANRMLSDGWSVIQIYSPEPSRRILVLGLPRKLFPQGFCDRPHGTLEHRQVGQGNSRRSDGPRDAVMDHNR